MRNLGQRGREFGIWYLNVTGNFDLSHLWDEGQEIIIRVVEGVLEFNAGETIPYYNCLPTTSTFGGRERDLI
jgi:hypothetical protein